MAIKNYLVINKIYGIKMHFLTECCQIQIENPGDINDIDSEKIISYQ